MESNYYGPVCLQAHSTAGSNQQIKLAVQTTYQLRQNSQSRRSTIQNTNLAETEPVKGIRTRSSTLSFRRRPSDPELLCPRCRRWLIAKQAFTLQTAKGIRDWDNRFREWGKRIERIEKGRGAPVSRQSKSFVVGFVNLRQSNARRDASSASSDRRSSETIQRSVVHSSSSYVAAAGDRRSSEINGRRMEGGRGGGGGGGGGKRGSKLSMLGN